MFLLYKTLTGVFFFQLFFLCASSVSAQFFPVMRWQTFFGTPKDDFATALCIDSDSNLVLAGYTEDSTRLESQGLLIKVKPGENKPIWTLQPGGASHDRILALTLVPDGSAILFAGQSGSALPQPDKSGEMFASNVWIGKINAQGKLLLDKKLGGSGPDRALAVTSTTFGSAVFAGSSWSDDRDLRPEPPPFSNAWIGILSRSGDLLKQTIWGGSGHEWATSIVSTRDGGFLVSGFTTSPELDSSRSRVNGDAWLLQLDLTGNIIWKQIFKKPLHDRIHSLAQNEYGMTYAAGTSEQEPNSRQFWIQKINTQGKVLFEKIFGFEGWEELTDVATCSDGGAIACGFSQYRNINHPYLKGRRDLWLIRFDANGKILWQQTFGGPNDEEAVSVIEYRTNRYFVLGRKANTFRKDKVKSGMDFWLICVDEQPCRGADAAFLTDLRGTQIKLGTPVKFINQSKNGETWLWEFGDGSTSTEKSPTHKYMRTGAFIARLTAIMNENCRMVYVYPQAIDVVE